MGFHVILIRHRGKLIVGQDKENRLFFEFSGWLVSREGRYRERFALMSGLRCLKLITISIPLYSALFSVTHAQERTHVDARSTAKEAIAERATALHRDAGGGWLFGTGDDDPLGAAESVASTDPNAPNHALYAVARRDKNGNSLHGASRYTIRFESKQLPPVSGFWSLTLYDAETKAVVPNALKRESIGDRTEGLVYGGDGSLNICVQKEEPKASDCNWLPAPDCGFYLVMRLYAPQMEEIEQGWTPPAIRLAR